jgi:signal transduction histidine kinase
LQDLVGVVFHLKAFSDDLPDTVDQGQVKEMQGNMQHIVSTLRTICTDLRPPTLAPFGLEKAIRSHAEDIQETHPEILIGLDLEPDGQSLPKKQRLVMFRIYQQAISNALLHARARNVLVRLQVNEKVILEVIDDGRGFQIPERWIDLARDGHLGLVSAFEQAEAIGGWLEVESEIGLGTILRLVAPSPRLITGSSQNV